MKQNSLKAPGIKPSQPGFLMIKSCQISSKTVNHVDKENTMMVYVLTKYSHKYVIYVTLLKKVCLSQGECKTDWKAIPSPNRKTNNLELFGSTAIQYFTFYTLYIFNPLCEISILIYLGHE